MLLTSVNTTNQGGIPPHLLEDRASFKVVQDFMPVLVIYKLHKVMMSINIFPIISLYDLLVATAIKFTSNCHEMHMPSIAHQSHAMNKIWLRSVYRLQR